MEEVSVPLITDSETGSVALKMNGSCCSKPNIHETSSVHILPDNCHSNSDKTADSVVDECADNCDRNNSSKDVVFSNKLRSLRREYHQAQKPRIGVVGTGNFAVAFTKCLVMAGYDVTMGSRKPAARKFTLPLSHDCLCGVELTNISECFLNSDVIFIAIHMEDFRATLGGYTVSSRGKVVVDVSNREYRDASHSNAEYLASILPDSVVVKAFNSIPAHAFDEIAGVGRAQLKVFVASDDQNGRCLVSEIAKSLGFLVVDLGQLKSARYMEEQVLKTFTLWRIPLFLTLGIFILWSLFVLYLYYMEKSVFSWEQIFLKVLNKPLCMTAITLLTLTYLPGKYISSWTAP